MVTIRIFSLRLIITEYDKWDNWAGNIAGLCALYIAWFPTTKTFPLDLSWKIHFIAASIFFIAMACFSVLLFTRKGENPTRQKLKRNIINIICGLVMIVCLIAMMIYFIFFQESHLESNFVFWFETAALVSFRISLLTKGGTLYPDEKSAIMGS